MKPTCQNQNSLPAKGGTEYFSCNQITRSLKNKEINVSPHTLYLSLLFSYYILNMNVYACMCAYIHTFIIANNKLICVSCDHSYDASVWVSSSLSFPPSPSLPLQMAVHLCSYFSFLLTTVSKCELLGERWLSVIPS